MIFNLRDFEGTFVSPRFGHSADVWASYEYVPEAKEEENRVNSAGVHSDAPERWFTPAPVIGRSWKKVKGFPRKAQVHTTSRKTYDLSEISTELREAEKGRFLNHPSPAHAIVDLLKLNPNLVWTIYSKAWEEQRHDVRNALVKAMGLVRGELRTTLRRSLGIFPDTSLTRRMLEALAPRRRRHGRDKRRR